jgi:hypothetical protein
MRRPAFPKIGSQWQGRERLQGKARFFPIGDQRPASPIGKIALPQPGADGPVNAGRHKNAATRPEWQIGQTEFAAAVKMVRLLQQIRQTATEAGLERFRRRYQFAGSDVADEGRREITSSGGSVLGHVAADVGELHRDP